MYVYIILIRCGSECSILTNMFGRVSNPKNIVIIDMEKWHHIHIPHDFIYGLIHLPLPMLRTYTKTHCKV